MAQSAAGLRMKAKLTSSVRVWDPLVRSLHWLLMIAIAGAWIMRHRAGAWHERWGYVTAAVVLVRILWGFIGTSNARFASFVAGPRAVRAYLTAMLRGRAPRHVGHNPLGALMIVAMLLNLALICITGWMFGTDTFFGVAWVINTHLYATYALFAMVALHLVGVLHACISQRENLVAAMLHGRKRKAPSEDAESQIQR